MSLDAERRLDGKRGARQPLSAPDLTSLERPACPAWNAEISVPAEVRLSFSDARTSEPRTCIDRTLACDWLAGSREARGIAIEAL
jgi:hypothetical protein